MRLPFLLCKLRVVRLLRRLGFQTHIWTSTVELTQPGDKWRTYRATGNHWKVTR